MTYKVRIHSMELVHFLSWMYVAKYTIFPLLSHVPKVISLIKPIHTSYLAYQYVPLVTISSQNEIPVRSSIWMAFLGGGGGGGVEVPNIG